MIVLHTGNSLLSLHLHYLYLCHLRPSHTLTVSHSLYPELVRFLLVVLAFFNFQGTIKFEPVSHHTVSTFVYQHSRASSSAESTVPPRRRQFFQLVLTLFLFVIFLYIFCTLVSNSECCHD